MKVENAVHPDPANIKPFIETDGPVCMVNLLKFREKAAYPDGRDPELSGREAYLRYGRAMVKLVEATGGRFIFAAEVKGLLLGEVEELWDEVALIEIASTPEFREIEVHREAGLAGQLNLTTSERSAL